MKNIEKVTIETMRKLDLRERERAKLLRNKWLKDVRKQDRRVIQRIQSRIIHFKQINYLVKRLIHISHGEFIVYNHTLKGESFSTSITSPKDFYNGVCRVCSKPLIRKRGYTCCKKCSCIWRDFRNQLLKGKSIKYTIIS